MSSQFNDTKETNNRATSGEQDMQSVQSRKADLVAWFKNDKENEIVNGEENVIPIIGMQKKLAKDTLALSETLGSALIFRVGHPPSVDSPRAYKTGEILSKTSNHGFFTTLIPANPIFNRLNNNREPISHHVHDIERLQSKEQETSSIYFTARELLDKLQNQDDLEISNFDPITKELTIQYRPGKGPKDFNGKFYITLGEPGGKKTNRIFTTTNRKSIPETDKIKIADTVTPFTIEHIKTLFTDLKEGKFDRNGSFLDTREYPLFYTSKATETTGNKKEIKEMAKAFSINGKLVTGDWDALALPKPIWLNLSDSCSRTYDTFGGPKKDFKLAFEESAKLFRASKEVYEILKAKGFLSAKLPPFGDLTNQYSLDRAGCITPYEFVLARVLNYQFRRNHIKNHIIPPLRKKATHSQKTLKKPENKNKQDRKSTADSKNAQEKKIKKENRKKIRVLLKKRDADGKSLIDRITVNPSIITLKPAIFLLRDDKKTRDFVLQQIMTDKNAPLIFKNPEMPSLLEKIMMNGEQLNATQDMIDFITNDPSVAHYINQLYHKVNNIIIENPSLLDKLSSKTRPRLNSSVKSLIQMNPKLLNQIVIDASMWDPIQHGAEIRNPYKPSDLNSTIVHFYLGKVFLTRNEDQLISFFMHDHFLATNKVEVHFGWNLEKWGPVIERQLAIGKRSDIPAETLKRYELLKENKQDTSQNLERRSSEIYTPVRRPPIFTPLSDLPIDSHLTMFSSKGKNAANTANTAGHFKKLSTVLESDSMEVPDKVIPKTDKPSTGKASTGNIIRNTGKNKGSSKPSKLKK